MKKLFRAIVTSIVLVFSGSMLSAQAAQFDANDIAANCADGGVEGPGGMTVTVCNPLFIVAYIEVDPSSTGKAKDLIMDYVKATANASGNVLSQGLQRIGRDNHFVVLQTWSKLEDQNKFATAGVNTKYRDAIYPLLSSPYDERPHLAHPVIATDAADNATGSSVFAVTHVDIIPPEQLPDCKRAAVSTGPCGDQLVQGLVKDSRGHKGNQRYDALVQANRTNHYTVIEVWANKSAQEAHSVNADTRKFRDTFWGLTAGKVPSKSFVNPLSGALIDERLYQLMQ